MNASPANDDGALDVRPALNAPSIRLPLLAAFLACAVAFTVLYGRASEPYERATLPMLTQFTAQTPFQYRVLVPALAHALTALAPATPLDGLYQVLTVFVVWALLIAFHAYLLRRVAPPLAAAGAFLLLYPLVANYALLHQFSYPSDLPAILFFVLGLIAIETRRMPALLVVFTLATFNRETSCFITLAYLLHAWRDGHPRRAIAGAAAMAVIWVAIRVWLARTFSGNPGPPVAEIHFLPNLVTLLAPNGSGLPRVLMTFGGLWLLIPLAWRDVPIDHRRLLWLAIPFAAIMLVVANVWEIRLYGELIPIVTLAALPGLKRLCDTV